MAGGATYYINVDGFFFPYIRFELLLLLRGLILLFLMVYHLFDDFVDVCAILN